MTAPIRTIRLADHATAVAQAGEGPALILLHAIGLDHGVWADVMPRLAGRFRMIAYDLRGFGAATAAPPIRDMAGLAADGLRVMDALGVSQAHVCGLSLGAAVAGHMALAEPARCASLTLACGLPMGLPVFEDRAAQAQAGGMAAVIPETMARWFSEPERIGSPEACGYVEARLAACAAPHWAAAWRAMAHDAALPRLAGLPVPRRIIAGELDASLPLSVARAAAAAIDAPLHVVSGAGHLPPLTQPQAFVAALLAESD